MENLSKEKQIESTDWLTRGISKEQLEREKRAAIMSADLELCHTEFATGVGEIYTDYDATAQKLIAKGWSKQSEGEWIKDQESKFEHRYHCSVCNFYLIGEPTKHCEDCGAKMKGGAE